MRIVGTGIDLVEVARIASSLERFGERFLNRVFTTGEILYCRSKQNAAERFAARFAAKEAALKAIGTGWRGGVGWKEVEVCREPSGRPTIVFSGRAAHYAAQLEVVRASLSLTHTAEHALAQVILEAPDLEAPAVEAPAVEAPAVEAPAVEAPAVEAPAVEGPAVEAPDVAGSRKQS